MITGAWVDAGAIGRAPLSASSHLIGARGREHGAETNEETERRLRSSIDSINSVGVKTIIYTYPEWNGIFYFPSKVEFFDNDVKKMSRGSECTFDQIEVILSQADKNGQHVGAGSGS